MRRNNLIVCMKYLHFQDNTQLDVIVRYTKIRLPEDHIQKKFLEHFAPRQTLSHDEVIIEYFGGNSLKQYIIQKQIRFGFEVFGLNTVDEYLVALELYQGKKGAYNEKLVARFRKRTATALTLLEKLPKEKSDLTFHLTCDNSFTSLELFQDPAKSGYNVTGTMRANRIPKNWNLKSVQTLKKKSHGSYS